MLTSLKVTLQYDINALQRDNQSGPHCWLFKIIGFINTCHKTTIFI